ncbi:MAG TPA: urease accessory protein UreD [Polyangiaceae bacterium]
MIPASARESSNSTDVVPPERGWHGRLELAFRASAGRTGLSRNEHRGPLVVQRPFYPEANGCCHVYLVHPPGGVVGGDQLELDVRVNEQAHALITTPAATKLYRSSGPSATIAQRLVVERGATLEWLPQETIAFSGSIASLTTHVELARGASFVGMEVLCLGRPAAGERFERGRLRQRLEIWQGGQRLLIEQLRLTGGGPELRQAWGLGGHTTLGTLVAVHGLSPEAWARRVPDLVLRVREEVAPLGGLAAVTQVAGALVCRFLGDGARPAQAVLRRAWELVRPELTQSPAVAPRIWAT